MDLISEGEILSIRNRTDGDKTDHSDVSIRGSLCFTERGHNVCNIWNVFV